MRWGIAASLWLVLGCGGGSANGGDDDDGNSGTGESGEGTGESGSTTETSSETGEPDLPAPDLPGEACGGDGQAEPGEVCFEHVDLIEDAWFSGYILVADLDDDGKLDVLQGVEIPCPDVQIDTPWPGKGEVPVEGAVLTSLRWYPGNGDGTLDAHVEVDTPSWIVAMAVNQFNGYAFSDLGVAMGGEPGSAVVVEGGQGMLPNPLTGVDSVLPDAVYAATFGQLSGDGWADLVITRGQGPATIYFNDATGAFGDPLDVPLPDPYLLPTTGDFDGDGRVDLALLQQANAGDVEVRAHVYWDVAQNGVDAHWQSPVMPGAVAITAGDLDGDGDDELLVGDGENELLRVLPGAQAGLEAEVVVEVGAVRSLTVGHFDGDALLDVAAYSDYPGEPTVHVVLGHANDVVGANVELAEEGEHGQFVDSGDLNGDGVDDIVFGDMHALLSSP